MDMSRHCNSLVASVLILSGVAAMSLGSATGAETDCKALVITGHPSYPPVAWASHGAIVGAAPKFVGAIAARLGVTSVVSKDFGTWEAAQQAARGGQADVIFGIYKNEARAAYLDYVEPPFMMDPVSVVVRKGSGFGFAEWSDLKNRKGVTNLGESYGDKFDTFMTKELTVVRAAGVDKAFAELVAQRADYMIVGLFPGRDEARKLGLIEKVEFLPKELVSAAMYVAFSKQSRCGALRDGFATGIKTAVDANVMQQLLEAADKNLGQ
jgi:polar amino acid transport system substrate-binding protein